MQCVQVKRKIQITFYDENPANIKEDRVMSSTNVNFELLCQ